MIQDLFKNQNRVMLILGVFLFFCFAVITIWGKDGLVRLMELRQIRDQIAADNRDILFQNFEHSLEIEKLKTEEYVEHIARKDLGMIRQDEMIYIVNSPAKD